MSMIERAKNKREEFKLVKESNEPQCKGIYFRGRVNSYWDYQRKKITTRKELVFLKRQSCSGCEKCDWYWDYFSEDVSMDPQEDYIGHIQHGKLYTPKVHTSRGFEDLYDEIDCIEFVEVNHGIIK